MRKIMILGASILQLPAIKKAKEMGLLTVVVDMNPNAVGFLEEGIIKEVISTTDSENILEAAIQNDVDGIITLASDTPMQAVSVVAEKLGLVGISRQTALITTNKASMRECLRKHNVPIPNFSCVQSKKEYDSEVRRLRTSNGGSYVVKPADNSGSRGVSLLSDLADKEAVERAYHYGKAYSNHGEVILEEYMDGPEVSVEGISISGTCHIVQITDKITTGPPYFVEMGHSEPSMLPEVTKERIRKVALAAVEAVGIMDGPSHTEIKITNKSGPKIVELGARLGGDNIATYLVPLSSGVDLVKLSIQIALGEQPKINHQFSKGSAIRYLKTNIGKIESITGIEEAEAVTGVTQVSIVHGTGDQAVEIKNSGDRVGFVIAQSNTAEDAVRAAETGLSKINVTVQ